MDCCGNPTLSPFSKDPDERLMKGRKYRKLSDLVYLWTVPNIPEAQVLHVQQSSANILRPPIFLDLAIFQKHLQTSYSRSILKVLSIGMLGNNALFQYCSVLCSPKASPQSFLRSVEWRSTPVRASARPPSGNPGGWLVATLGLSLTIPIPCIRPSVRLHQ